MANDQTPDFIPHTPDFIPHVTSGGSPTTFGSLYGGSNTPSLSQQASSVGGDSPAVTALKRKGMQGQTVDATKVPLNVFNNQYMVPPTPQAPAAPEPTLSQSMQAGILGRYGVGVSAQDRANIQQQQQPVEKALMSGTLPLDHLEKATNDYLNDPNQPKSRGWAFTAGASADLAKTLNDIFLSPVGLASAGVGAVATRALAQAGRTGNEALSSMAEYQRMVRAGASEADLLAQHAKTQAAITATVNMDQLRSGANTGLKAAGAGFGAQGADQMVEGIRKKDSSLVLQGLAGIAFGAAGASGREGKVIEGEPDPQTQITKTDPLGQNAAPARQVPGTMPQLPERTLEKFDPQKPVAAIETPQQAVAGPSKTNSAVDVTKISSGELARQMFDGPNREAAKEEMMRREGAARLPQTSTPQDQFVNSLGLKSVGTQNGLVNIEHPEHPGLSAAVPIAQGMDANAIRSAMLTRLQEFGQDPAHNNPVLQRNIAAISNRLPPPVAPASVPQFSSGSRAIAAAPSKDLGPAFNEGQQEGELARAQAILSNPNRTNEDSRAATQRLQELGGSAQSTARTGPLSTPSPVQNNASGESDASQESIHRVAVNKQNGIQRFRIDGSGNPIPLTGVDAVDWHPRADGNEHLIEKGPNGTTVLESGSKARPYNTRGTTAAPTSASQGVGSYDLGEINPSASPDAIAEKLQSTAPAPVSASLDVPPPVFDAEDFNMRMASGEKWDHQLKSKTITGRQADNYDKALVKIRKGSTDLLNSVIAADPTGSNAHLDVTKEADRLRDQAKAGRDVVTQNPLAKALRGEMVPRPNRPWKASIQLSSVDENNVFHEINEPLPGALRDLIHTKLLGDQTTVVPSKIPEDAWTPIRTAAEAQMADAKKTLTIRMETLVPDSDESHMSPKERKAAAAGRLSQALRDELLYNGRDLKTEVATLQSILGPGRERLRYVSKGSPVVDENGVVRAPGVVQEKSVKWARAFLNKPYLNDIPDDATLLRHADNLEARAVLLDKVAKKMRDRQEAGAISGGTLGMASGGMAVGTGVGFAVGGPAGAVVGGATGFVAGMVLPAMYRPMLGVLDSLHNEIKGYGLNLSDNAKGVTTSLVNFLVPKAGVDTKILDAIYTFKGDEAKANTAAANVLDVYRKALDALGTQGQIDWIDRMKSGQQQVTPELQALADVIRRIDNDNLDKLRLFKPGTPFRENHFRLLYKTLPGGATGFQNWVGKRPLQGSKGFLHQQVYDTLSDAMANGGVPVTTNPVDLFLLSHADVQRFIHANMLDKWAKANGVGVFQRTGSDRPAGYTPLDDRSSKVYFPASSGEGLVNPGQWVYQTGYARLMNNYLSIDHIRQSILGKAIIDFKNAANGWSLVGGFHAVTVTAAGTVQNLSIAEQRMHNLGIRKKSGADFAGGIKDLIAAPTELAIANRPAYLEGKNLQEFGAAIDRYKYGDPHALNQFANSDAGHQFLQMYPDAEALLGDAFQGGLNMKLSSDIRSNVIKNMQQAFQDKRYIGGLARIPGAALMTMNKPLFEYGIPRLKLGMFLRDMSQQLKDRAPELLAGTLTRETLARQVVNRIENAFGEMNYDNFFWNKTFKTAMQFFYRSVTWRLGTQLLLGEGAFGQGKEFVNAAKQGNVARLDPNFGFVASAIIMLGITSAVIQKIMSGKNPSSLADLTHPQDGTLNEDGRPNRLNIPGYGSEFLKDMRHPLDYLASGRSGPIDQMVESWNNKDFYHKQISDPNDPKLLQWSQRVLHAIAPQVIFNENMNRMRAQGASKTQAALGFFGFSVASKSIDQTPAELKAQEIIYRSMPSSGRTEDSVTHSQAITNVLTDIQNNRDPNPTLNKGFDEGSLQPKDLDAIDKRLGTPLLEQKLEGRNVHMVDVLSVYDLANAQEKMQLIPVVTKHLDELDKMTPAIRNQMLPRIERALAGQ